MEAEIDYRSAEIFRAGPDLVEKNSGCFNSDYS